MLSLISYISMDFALTEPLANVSYLTELVIWLLTLIVWVYTPGLIGVAVGAWRQGNPDSGAVYISRFVSYGLFRFLSYVLGSLSIALTMLRLSSHEGLLLGSDYTSLVMQLSVLFVGVYLFLYFRSKAFKLWRYVLLDDLTGGLLAQDYFFQDWLRALLMALVSLLTFAPLPTLVLWWIAIGTLVLVQLLGIIQAVRRMSHGSAGGLFLFLYLCAHEVVPFLYLVGGGIYLMRSDLLPNLYQ